MGNGRYITIQEWMLELDLTLTELQAFALIYGFSQDGRSTYHGGLDYLAYWLKKNTNTACTTLNNLVKKGLIDKIEHKTGSIKTCEYKVCKKFIHNKNCDGSHNKNRYGSHNKNCDEYINRENKRDNKSSLSLALKKYEC